MPSRSIRLFSLLILSCITVFSQSMVSATASSNGGVMKGSMHFSPRPFFGPAVTGAPYSGQRVSEHVQTAADGTRFTTSFEQETIYRDSQGRTRTERPFMRPMPAGPKFDTPMMIEIEDPVLNVGYVLDTSNKIAHRYTVQPMPVRQGRTGAVAIAGGGGGGMAGGTIGGVIGSVAHAPATVGAPGVTGSSSAATAPGSAAAVRPNFSHEDLGTQIIDGILVKGSRTTQTWPAGSQGSDRPFATTSENWYSEDLHLTVLSKYLDPRNGENTNKLININRAEPSPDLFVPPPDYTVVDETGSFTIEWTATRAQ
jgi:hypothetical protein